MRSANPVFWGAKSRGMASASKLQKSIGPQMAGASESSKYGTDGFAELK
jgi:hypothetical protein